MPLLVGEIRADDLPDYSVVAECMLMLGSA
jgi:hypothetical protein